MSVLNKTFSLLFYRIILIPFRRRIFQFDVCVCVYVWRFVIGQRFQQAKQ